MKKFFIIFPFLFGKALAQTGTEKDSVKTLNEIIVRAYENNRKLVDVGAAVSVVSKSDIDRYSNISILPALNNNPGVRMEERSPASYHISIRDSTLRSPFGVRNVPSFISVLNFSGVALLYSCS